VCSSDLVAAKLRDALKRRLADAVRSATNDSPLFQLLPGFPGIDLKHEVTGSFETRVRYEARFRKKLDEARNQPTNGLRREALQEIQTQLGDLKLILRSILMDLLLSHRAVEAWDEMVALCEAMPDHLQAATPVRQQWALALNRRSRPGDRDAAARLLEALLKERGPDSETLGILGRIHKDRYRDAKKTGDLVASAALDDAIDCYTRGFESDPRDYYPGVNAITLLLEKGTPEAMRHADRLVPLVAFAVARRGGARSSDYWDLATVLELACIANDWETARHVLPRALAAARESFMPRTTADNLVLLQEARARSGQVPKELDEIIGHLRERVRSLGDPT
jgi:tetratricopeptide (TPR) repeat protein